jgi:hypothetical protein
MEAMINVGSWVVGFEAGGGQDMSEGKLEDE